jgi:amidohydrolase
MNRIDPIVLRILPRIVELRHTLHAHPELCHEEYGTSRMLAENLNRLPGLAVQMGVGGTTGIKAVLGGDRPAPAVLLRADMDALPIQEIGDLPYKSQTGGKMHACGHDGHSACLVGVATILSEIADELPGPIVFIFQPAEETGGGGKLLVDAGILESPKVGAAFALHGWPKLQVGQIGICRGQAMAATGGFHIAVKAKGAHGAAPHESPDPIVVSARIIDALQQIPSRMISPLEPVVVTVGTIHGGTALNIIPSCCEMSGTVRALSDQVRAQILQHVERIAKGIAATFGATAEVEVREAYPAVYNDPAACDFVAQVAREAIGPDAVVEHGPTMGGEDFAYYLQKVPGAMIRLGVDAPDRPSAMLHQPQYDFNDDALPIGMKMMAHLAVRWLGSRGQ